MKRRVKITGIGPVTPAGIGREAFWKGILEPVSRIRPYSGLGKDFGPIVAAHMEDFDIGVLVDRHLVPRGVARHTEFAVAGTVMALSDAGVATEELKRSGCAIVTGSSLMDFGSINKAINGVEKKGSRGAIPRMVYTATLSNIVETVNVVLGLNARTMTFSTSCCSGLDAIGFAAEMVARGEVDFAIAGGIDAPLVRTPILELRAAGLTPNSRELAHRIARPFDLWRTTGVVSEGGCMFLLEPASSPRRGYAMIAGWASASDDNGDLCSGLAPCAREAMADAGLRPNDLDTISAWGPGHKEVDKGEVRAMGKVFGPHLREIPAVSIKGAIGAPLGAGPAIQVAAVALGFRDGLIPPTVNWEFPDPECDLNLSNRARHIHMNSALVNAHGIGRNNSSLVMLSP